MHASAFVPLMVDVSLHYLTGNNIQNFDDLSAIGRKCLGIKTLYLKEINGSLANPVCSANNYRETMLAYFPNLKVLDGERLRKVDCIYRLTDEINKLFPSMQHEQDVIRRLQEEEKKKDSKAAMMDWIPYNCLIPTILQSEADIIADMQIKSLSNAVEDCTQLEKVCDDMVSSLGYQAKEIWMTELNKLTIGGVLTK